MLPWHLISPETNYPQTSSYPIHFFLMEMFVLSYVNVPQTLSSSWFHQMAQTTWQTSMLYSDIVPLIYVNETICVVICPSTRFKSIISWPGMNYLVPKLSQNAIYGWGAWCHSEFSDIRFFSLTDFEWLYNIQLKTRRGVLFLPPSDAYVRSFL